MTEQLRAKFHINVVSTSVDNWEILQKRNPVLCVCGHEMCSYDGFRYRDFAKFQKLTIMVWTVFPTVRVDIELIILT